MNIEAGAMLARLHVQVVAGGPKRAPLVARLQHLCAARFEALARSCAWPQRASAEIDGRRH